MHASETTWALFIIPVFCWESGHICPVGKFKGYVCMMFCIFIALGLAWDNVYIYTSGVFSGRAHDLAGPNQIREFIWPFWIKYWNPSKAL
jgi:hypothetical protein